MKVGAARLKELPGVQNVKISRKVSSLIEEI